MTRVPHRLGLLRSLAVGLVVGLAAPALAAPLPARGEDLRVSLVTFSPGDDIASWFGHTALLVENTARNEARIYNYGMFSFDDTMLAKFVAGRLEFWVGEDSPARTFRLYARLNRDIRLQELNLTPEARRELAEFLAWNVRPENRTYLYHHYDDNCATRVRDIIDRAVGGQLEAATRVPARFSLREHTRRHSQHEPIVDFVLMLWEGDLIDRPITRWDEMFLPEELERALDELTYVDANGARVPLVASRRIVYRAQGRPPVPREPNLGWPLWLCVGLALVGVAAGSVRLSRANPKLGRITWGSLNAALGVSLGLLGLTMVFFYFTDHAVAHWNENVLLVNPVTFALLPLGVGTLIGWPRAERALEAAWLLLAASTVLALGAKLLPAFDQDNTLALALFVPVNLGFAAAAHVRRRARAAPEKRLAASAA